MKRLSLEELKAQKADKVTQNLEEIKGGELDWCHAQDREAIVVIALIGFAILAAF